MASGLGRAGQPVRLGLVQESAGHDVASQYGYRWGDKRERRRVDVMIEGLFAQLAHAGVVARDGDEVASPRWAGVLAGMVDVIAGLGLSWPLTPPLSCTTPTIGAPTTCGGCPCRSRSSWAKARYWRLAPNLTPVLVGRVRT